MAYCDETLPALIELERPLDLAGLLCDGRNFEVYEDGTQEDVLRS